MGNYWNGKCYNYEIERIRYYGEFFHGEKSGRGEEYSLIGNKIYEGEFLYGKRHGKGKVFNDSFDEIMKFEGIFKYGKLIKKINHHEEE